MSDFGKADFREAIRDYIAREAQPGDKFGHQPRLYGLTRQIGAGHEYDDDIVFAAAWLHDIGVFIGHRPEDAEELARWDNVVYAVERAPALLAEMRFPREKAEAVVEAIRTHRPDGNPTTLEGTILRDGDILEQLGAIGILRTVSKVGRDTRFPGFTAAAEALRKTLAMLPGQIRLETTRELARPKVQVLEAFLKGIDAESNPGLF